MAKNDWKARRFFFPSRDYPDVQIIIRGVESGLGKRLKGGDGYVVMPDAKMARVFNTYIRMCQQVDRELL